MAVHDADVNHGRARWRASLSRIAQYWSALTHQVWAKWLALGLLLVLSLVTPLIVHSNYWVRVFAQAGLGIMMALGLNIIAGYTGLLNLGYAGFYAVGAYTYALLASPQHNIHLPFLLLFPLAGLVAALVGGLLALPVLSLKGDFLALITLAFGEIIRILLNNLTPLTGGPIGIPDIDHVRILSYTIHTPSDYYYLVLVICIVEIFVMARLAKSKIGRSWTAIREDEDAARGMGLNSGRLKLLACIIGTAPAGLAGVLFAAMQKYVSPVSFSSAESIGVLCMVIVGGAANVPGVVLGALLLTILPEPLRQYTDRYRMLIYGVVLVLFVLFRPMGMWPADRRLRHERENPAGPVGPEGTGTPGGGESTAGQLMGPVEVDGHESIEAA